MKSCIYCGNVIDSKEERCPYCGREQQIDRREAVQTESVNRNANPNPVPQETILFDFDKLNTSEDIKTTPEADDIYSSRKDYLENYRDNRQPAQAPQKKEMNKPFIIGMSVAGVIIVILIILLIVVAGGKGDEEQPIPSTMPMTTVVPETSIPITSAPPITEPTTETTTIEETTVGEEDPEETTEEEYTTEPPIVISSPLSGIWMTNVVLGNGQVAEDICVFRGDGTMNVTIESAEISVEGTYTIDGDSITTSVTLLGGRNSNTYTYEIDGDKLTSTDSQGNQIIFQKIQ